MFDYITQYMIWSDISLMKPSKGYISLKQTYTIKPRGTPRDPEYL